MVAESAVEAEKAVADVESEEERERPELFEESKRMDSAVEETVYVVQPQSVEIVHQAGNRVLVTGTLQPEAVVVASGAHRLVPGQQVKPVEQIPEPIISPVIKRDFQRFLFLYCALYFPGNGQILLYEYPLTYSVDCAGFGLGISLFSGAAPARRILS